MLGFSWESGATAFASGGGGAVLAVDVDMLVFDLYGGPFASVFLGEKLRAYVAAGPLLNWVRYDQEGSALDADGDGFGVGYYARTGLELALPGSMLGVGVRWSDSTTDLDGGLGELELEGFQVAFTVSRYF